MHAGPIKKEIGIQTGISIGGAANRAGVRLEDASNSEDYLTHPSPPPVKRVSSVPSRCSPECFKGCITFISGEVPGG